MPSQAVFLHCTLATAVPEAHWTGTAALCAQLLLCNAWVLSSSSCMLHCIMGLVTVSHACQLQEAIALTPPI